MEDLSKKLWEIEEAGRINRLAWDWWWWIFFIPDKNPKKTKQLMILWSTKKTKEVSINDYIWKRKGEIEKISSGKNFNGIVAAWYFDGKKMLDPLVLEEINISVKQGLLQDENGKYVFRGGKNFSVDINSKYGKFSFNMNPWTKFLSEKRYFSRNYFGNFGYQILKIYGMKLSGKLPSYQKKITGSAYFQKVRVNAPSVPWYWGIFQCSNGSFIEYFIPHIGLSSFRRSSKQESKLDKVELHLSKNLKFFHEPSKKLYTFHKVSLKKKFKNNLPVFLISATDGKRALNMKVRAYSRACWKFKQPLMGKISTKLFYNEYPTILEEFEFFDGEKKISRKDLGTVVGNTEHAWGTLF